MAVWSEQYNRLCEEIETVRGQMVELGIAFGFLHPDVQRCSRKLDQLLLRFYALDRACRLAKQASALEPISR